MTLDEALQIMAAAIIVTITEQPGYKLTSHMLFNAIMNEWLDGSFIRENTELEQVLKEYGGNAFQQAARVIANKTEIYGDVR